MPNWCENKLKICGKKKDREDMLTFVSITIPAKKNGAIANNIPGEHIPFTFNRIIPYPQKFRDLDEECDKKRTELEAMSAAEREKYIDTNGYPSDGFNSGGYQWSCDSWGTKWDACDVVIAEAKTSTTISFQTPWGPPEPVIRKLAELFPQLKFTLSFWERGMAFQGKYTYENGVQTKRRVHQA